MKRLLTIIFFTYLGLYANIYGQNKNFSREKELLLLQKLDSLVLKYEIYSSLINNPPEASLQNSELARLFTDTSAFVFDDINPNNTPKTIETIFEKHKTISQYIRDTWQNYSTLSCNIYETNLGNSIERIFYKDDILYIPVTVKKELKGYSNEEFPTYYRTDSELKIVIRVTDTINFEMKIDFIDKTTYTSTNWQTTPPEIKQKRVETSFYLAPCFSYFYSSNYRTDSYFLNDTINGSYGLSAGINWRIILKRKYNRSLGLTFGIQGGWNNSIYQNDNYISVRNNFDIDNDKYFHINEVSQLSENITFYSLSAPLYLHRERWKLKNMNKGRYFMLGGKFSYFMPVEYSARSGLFNTKGFYPQYNAMIYDISDYNFISTNSYESQGGYDINPHNFSVDLSFGRMKISRNRNSVKYFGIDISVYALNFIPDKENYLFSIDNKYNSILSEFADGRLGYIGLKFGIRANTKNEVFLRRKIIKQIYPLETSLK